MVTMKGPAEGKCFKCSSTKKLVEATVRGTKFSGVLCLDCAYGKLLEVAAEKAAKDKETADAKDAAA